MAKNTIFNESILVSGIMCLEYCGVSLQSVLECALEDLKKEKKLPPDASLILSAEPFGIGLQRITITVQSSHDSSLRFSEQESILKKFRDEIPFEIIDDLEQTATYSSYNGNWINIGINFFSIALVIFLSLAFPPSLLLTASLVAISFTASAFTARSYLRAFYYNFKQKQFANMGTTISLGWMLSLAHTLFHTITMPLSSSFSMVIMNFVMPNLLIAGVNGTDEIKRRVLSYTKKIQLNGIKKLFPQMAETYDCYTHEQVITIEESLDRDRPFQAFVPTSHDRNSIEKGWMIKIPRGTCFPVDCALVDGTTVVNSTIVSGEPCQLKQAGNKIPGGSINLGEEVTVFALENGYNSSINRVLFRANRAIQSTAQSKENHTKFITLYSILIGLGLVIAVLSPIGFGMVSLALLIQNITGILFSVCPCTITLAHQLPQLFNKHQQQLNGVVRRDDDRSSNFSPINTVVFDKTGTLTTGNSNVHSSEGLDNNLWSRLYLLEKQYGAAHHLARAITNYYEEKHDTPSLFQDIHSFLRDPLGRGLSATVQGKVLHVGNLDYLHASGIVCPPANLQKTQLGFTPIYIAEDGHYKGIVYIQHEIRPDVVAALKRLKAQGVQLIMLTGDSANAAHGFNQQNGTLFAKERIFADQTPKMKEQFLADLMSQDDATAEGLWFIGDGLNDAPCARVVSEKGGVSCAITSDEKAAFFTDISLNGTLDYLFSFDLMNRFTTKATRQNQAVLAGSSLLFIAIMISLSITGIGVAPLLPLLIMMSTTGIVLFNSYRVKLAVNCALDKRTHFCTHLVASDLSISLLTAGCLLVIAALLLSTIVTGGLALPALTFSTGALISVSTLLTLTGITMLTAFCGFLVGHLLSNKQRNQSMDETLVTPRSELKTETRPALASVPHYPTLLSFQTRPRPIPQNVSNCSSSASSDRMFNG